MKKKKLRNEILESNSNVDSDKLDESIDIDNAIKAINTAKEEAGKKAVEEEAAITAAAVVVDEIEKETAKKIEEQQKKIQQAEKKALEEEADKIVKKLSLQNVVKEQVARLIQAKVELKQRVEYRKSLSNIGATKLKNQIKYLQETKEAVKDNDNDKYEYKKIEIKLAAAKEEVDARRSIVQGTRRYIKEAFKGFYDDSINYAKQGLGYGALVGLAGFAVALTVAVAFPAALPIAAIAGTIGISSLGTAGTVALGAVAAPVAGAIAGTALVETVAAVKNGAEFIYNEASIIPNKLTFKDIITSSDDKQKLAKS
jgi:hypothetical protein